MKSKFIAIFSGVLILCTGCSSLVTRAVDGIADDLTSAVLNQNDPATVRAAVPAYLIMLDGFVEGNPESVSMLVNAANLYAAYGSIFVDEPARGKRLTQRAKDYGQRAMCLELPESCDWASLDYEQFTAALSSVDEKDAEAFYAYSIGWLAWIRAHSDDWNALADLPKIESALTHLATLPNDENVNVHLYLGILNSLRPPALGGKPEVAKQHFEKAIAICEGRDLGVKVEYARNYARLLYDRELHDTLLNEVLASPVEAPGLTLLNTIAKEQAQTLLDSAEEYF